MIQEDRELLAELARLNTDMPSLALRIMDGSASAREQVYYAERLVAAGERLRRRAKGMGDEVAGGTVIDEGVVRRIVMETVVIEGEVVEGEVAMKSETGGAWKDDSLALPSHTVEPDGRHTVEPARLDWRP